MHQPCLRRSHRWGGCTSEISELIGKLQFSTMHVLHELKILARFGGVSFPTPHVQLHPLPSALRAHNVEWEGYVSSLPHPLEWPQAGEVPVPGIWYRRHGKYPVADRMVRDAHGRVTGRASVLGELDADGETDAFRGAGGLPHSICSDCRTSEFICMVCGDKCHGTKLRRPLSSGEGAFCQACVPPEFTCQGCGCFFRPGPRPALPPTVEAL